MTKPHACPDPGDLQRLARGDLADAEVEQLGQHVLGCSHCAELLNAVDVQDPLIARLQAGCGQELLDNPVAEALVERLARTPPGHAMATTHSASANDVDGENADGEPMPQHVGRYQLVCRLGAGGMGVVYRAHDRELRRDVAIKMILGGAHASANQLRRFRLEAEAVAALQHPHIVQIHEIGEHQGLPYFALEFVSGGSLANQLDGTPWPAKTAARFVAILARAMQAAHERGIVHRDLKPANVLLSVNCEPTARPGGELAVGSRLTDWVPKISDFGLAKNLDMVGQTQSGEIMGTPSYMAPEQAAGHSSRVGPAADVYAVGAILYELVTGRPPFKAETSLETVLLVVSEEPLAPRSLQPRLPRDLDTICLTCLQKNPVCRYGSAADLAADLERFLANELIKARPTGLLERAAKWVRRRPVVAGLLALVALLSAGGLAGITWAYSEAVHERNQAQEANRRRVRTQLEQLGLAPAPAVPGILAALQDELAAVLPRLHEVWADAAGDRKQRMRAGLALLQTEPDLVRDELLTWLLEADDPAEVLLTRDLLAGQHEALSERLWARAAETKDPFVTRFHALAALAAFDPDSPHWTKYWDLTAEHLLSTNPLHLGTWVNGFRQVRGPLLRPLSAVFRTAQSPERRETAAAVLADYAADRSDVVIDLLLDADPKQYAVLFPVVQRYRSQAIERLRREINGDVHDAAVAPAGKMPDAALRQEIEQAAGLLNERFALCQTLPLARVAALAEGLRGYGYRPIRLRPYRHGGEVRAAALWTRDDGAWHLAVALKKEEVLEQQQLQRTKGYGLVDLAGYRTADADGYVALWCALAKVPDQQLIVGVPDGEAPRHDGYVCHTHQFFLSRHGKILGSQIRQRPDGPAPENWYHDGDVNFYETRVRHLDALLQVDVGLHGLPEIHASGVWHASGSHESTESHGLEPAQHLARCRQLAAEGYAPAALAVADQGKRTLVTASVWHRPVPRLATPALRRLATAALTLLRLDVPQDAWPLFRHRANPEVRSWMIWRAGTAGLSPALLLERLDEETDVSARRALILALGEYTDEQLHADLRGRWTTKLLHWYRNDPDPGIHGAIDWLLRHGREGPQPRRLDWGQAAALQKIDDDLREAAPAAGQCWLVNRTGLTMVRFPGPLTIQVGSPFYERDRLDLYERLHTRRIDRSFALAAKPITVAHWRQFFKIPGVKHAYSTNYSPEPDCPIISMTWVQAVQFCRLLSEKEEIADAQMCYPPIAEIAKCSDGVTPLKLPTNFLKRTGYRLPTEAEWEYACRAESTTSRYYGRSEELLSRYAWYHQDAGGRTWPVGQKRPNDFGLFDMHGNVWTWCQGVRARNDVPEPDEPTDDAEETTDTKEPAARALRGGSYNSYPQEVRSAMRMAARSDGNFTNAGLRPARTLP